MTRSIVAALTASLVLCSVVAADERRPALKQNVAVVGDIVRIGDLLTHAGSLADTAIFRAPDLGQTGMVGVARVLEAVRKHGLDDVDTRGAADVEVTRLARTISIKEIEQRVAAALAGRASLGDAQNLAITFDHVRQLHVEPDAGELTVARASFERSSSRFDVTFELPGSRRRLRYTGTVVETVTVAALVRSVVRGDIIQASDIEIERRPKTSVPGGALEQAEHIVGMAARRTLPAAQPLRAADLMRPELVRQHQAVTVIYEAPGLSLTLRGKALEAGAEGDVVSVLNIQTKRTMQGTVTGPGRIRIGASAPAPIASERTNTQSIAAAAPQQRAE